MGLLINLILFSESTDYSMLFYIQDICLAISIALCFFLDINMDRSGQPTKDALKRIVSKPALLFFLLLTFNGTMWGVHDTFLLAYWSEDLGASSSLISMPNKLPLTQTFLPSVVSQVTVCS